MLIDVDEWAHTLSTSCSRTLHKRLGAFFLRENSPSYLNILLPPAQFSRCLLGSHTTGWQQHPGWEKGSRNHQSTLCEAAVWSRVFDVCLWHEDVNNESECMQKLANKETCFKFNWLWSIPVENRLFQSSLSNLAHKHTAKTLSKPFCIELTLVCKGHGSSQLENFMNPTKDWKPPWSWPSCFCTFIHFCHFADCF